MIVARSAFASILVWRRRTLENGRGALCTTCCAHALAVATLSNDAVATLSVEASAASKATIVTATTAAMPKMQDVEGASTGQLKRVAAMT
eukprot:6212661-Pleurochrysis_carterae.AAC.2